MTTILHSTQNGNDTIPVVSAEGADIPVSTGTVALGYFTISDAAIMSRQGSLTAGDVSVIMGSFVPFGAPVTGSIGDPGFNLPSFFEYRSGVENLAVLGGSPFLGENVYTVVGLGGGGSLGGAEELLIYRHDAVFTPENPLPSITNVNLSVDFHAGAGSLLLGSYGLFQSDIGGALPPPQDALSLEGLVAPEPAEVDMAYQLMGSGVLELRFSTTEQGYRFTVQMSEDLAHWEDLPDAPHVSPLFIDPAVAPRAFFRVISVPQ